MRDRFFYMREMPIKIFVVVGVLLALGASAEAAEGFLPKSEYKEMLTLPVPKEDGEISLEKALKERRSRRNFTDKPISLTDISQLLWSAQGITSPDGLRTAPSAGALYPLEVYVICGNVEGLIDGIYRYQPLGHRLVKILEGDIRGDLAHAALGQECVRDSAALIVISAIYDRTTRKYGDRGIRYTQMEVGSAAQNILLEVTSLGLGSVIVGAFDDEKVKKMLKMRKNEFPLCLIPVGKTQ